MFWINVHTVVTPQGGVRNVTVSEAAATGPFSSRQEAERALTGLLSAGRVVAAVIVDDPTEPSA
jgi:hypothetical protein